MAKKLNKQEIKAWYYGEIIEMIDSFNETGIPAIFEQEEIKEMENLKARLIKRLGHINLNHDHTANQKLDLRLRKPRY